LLQLREACGLSVDVKESSWARRGGDRSPETVLL